MLFAYTLSTDAPSTSVEALRATTSELNDALLPPGYGLMPLWSTACDDAVRGYETDPVLAHMLSMIHALRQLTRRHPEVTVTISGGHGLPATQLQAGEFVLFGETYERALARRAGWGTTDERMLRIPS